LVDDLVREKGPFKYSLSRKDDDFLIHVLPLSFQAAGEDLEDLPTLSVEEGDPEFDDLPALTQVEDEWTDIAAPSRGSK
jgi:hypothetical protein